jgi:hypothetical protein
MCLKHDTARERGKRRVQLGPAKAVPEQLWDPMSPHPRRLSSPPFSRTLGHQNPRNLLGEAESPFHWAAAQSRS